MEFEGEVYGLKRLRPWISGAKSMRLRPQGPPLIPPRGEDKPLSYLPEGERIPSGWNHSPLGEQGGGL